MSQEPQTVSIRLLEKEFTVNCPPEARAELEAAARYLDEKMADIRRTGKADRPGTDRRNGSAEHQS